MAARRYPPARFTTNDAEPAGIFRSRPRKAALPAYGTESSGQIAISGRRLDPRLAAASRNESPP
jgi:hypothetical protein